MTKVELQKELKEKVRPGVKPSALKKLKRSKSMGELQRNGSSFNNERHIPKAPPLPQSTPLTKSKSAEELTPLTNSKIEELETKISVLNLNLETQKREIDEALIARHKNLKDWFAQYQKSKQLDAELSENIEQASTELIEQDQAISSLRKENSQLKQTNSQLEKDLNLAQRLAELRREPLKSSWPTFPSWGLVYLILSALALWFLMKPNHD